MEYNGIKLGNRMYNARMDKGMSQKEVGESLGMTQPAYSRYESGQRDATLKMLIQLSEIFEVGMWYFLED